MSFSSPPQILRIKRKRDQDPLQALILEDRNASLLRHKKSKPSSLASSMILTPPINAQNSQTDLKNSQVQKKFHESLLFTLARTDLVTDAERIVDDPNVIQSVLSEASGSTSKRKFVIPKRQLDEDTVIPHELSDMLSNLLTTDGASQPLSSAPPKKRRNKKLNAVLNAPLEKYELEGQTEATADQQVEDVPNSDNIESSGIDPSVEYVYDVYQLSPLTSDSHPTSLIGYVRFFDDEDNDLYQSDSADDDKAKVSDDEDSNAEDFYQNDYPSDEDAGSLASSFDPEGSVHIVGHDAFEGEAEEGYDYIDSQDVKDGEFENLYDQFYEGDEDDINLLDDDHFQPESDNESFERHQFFADDNENEMAIYRDKLYGKLKKMIDATED